MPKKEEQQYLGSWQIELAKLMRNVNELITEVREALRKDQESRGR